MGYSGAADVPFDFEGVLSLCRMLWNLADELDGVKTSRAAAATTALISWEGPFATEFTTRSNTEGTTAVQISAGLRGDAQGWAAAWKTAMDENNRRRWARHHQQWKDDQGFWDDPFGMFGNKDETPNPEPVSQPQPPGFAATGSLVNYG
jgi:hypothetical protein